MAAPNPADHRGATHGQPQNVQDTAAATEGKTATVESTQTPAGRQRVTIKAQERTYTNGVALEQIEPIPAHTFAGAYRPNFLAEWTGEECDKYNFLNCSFFSHSNGAAPTLIELKQHAQALCNLFKTLTVVDAESDTDDAFDWLDDLNTLYNNLSPSHSLPLNSVRNQIATVEDDATGADILLAGCTLIEGNGDRRDLAAHIEHANQLLECIDHECAADGGLFSILPHQGDPARAQTKDTILGQWLVYTTTLVQRVAELESELANSRDVLAREALAPMQLTTTGRMAEGKPLLFPQDRYVLANLTPEIWDVLNEELARKQQDQEATERAAAQALHGPATRTAPQAVPPLAPVVAIDIPSRAYRIPGSRTIFIVPGHAMHPGTAGTRTMEARGPLVQSVVRPEVGVRNTALGRAKDARIDQLYVEAQKRGSEIVRLREQLAVATAGRNTAEHALKLARLRAGEGRESERAQLARLLAAEAGGEGAKQQQQQQQQQEQQEGVGNAAGQGKAKGKVAAHGHGQGQEGKGNGDGAGNGRGGNAGSATAPAGKVVPEDQMVFMTY